VFVVGTNEDVPMRFLVAHGLGLQTLNAETDDIAGAIRGIGEGYGADVVVEASGSGAAIGNAVRIVRRAGRITVSGITGRKEIWIDWDALTAKEAIRPVFSFDWAGKMLDGGET